MAVWNFEELKKHLGHKTAVRYYLNENVTVECDTCNEVLLDFDEEEEK